VRIVPYDDDDDDNKTSMSIVPYAPGPKQRDRAYLIVLAGANVGEMYPVEGTETFLGRGEKAKIKLTDDGISRLHARIFLDGDGVRIEDVGSANGTIVNGERVERSVALKDGDKIQVGGTTILKFTYHDKLEETFQRQMYDAALRDHLTKTFNKKHFLERLDSEFAYAKRHRVQLAVIMLDLDFFKHVNDTWGHLAGDHVLATLANLVHGTLRSEDMLARYGGEEFAVLCRGSSPDAARIVAERIRVTVEHANFAFDGIAIPVTISSGVAAYPDFLAAGPSELLGAADAMLYEAKRTGRNRVAVRR